MRQASTPNYAANVFSVALGMPLSRVVYRSRAARPFSITDLRDLTEAAQEHNARENITGVVVYDNDRFYQWLEGPNDSVERLMHRINHDPRHMDVEVLDRSPSPVRSFAGWSMKLAVPHTQSFAPLPDAIDAPADIVQGLHARPCDASALLVKLVSLSARLVTEKRPDAPRRPTSSRVLTHVFLSEVVPHLVRGAGLPGQERLVPDARFRDLAESLVSEDLDAALAWLAPLQEDGRSLGQLAASLFEPVARRLGDLWADDICSEFDVTFGLCQLQTLVRLLSAPCPNTTPVARGPRTLIAPEPGELHRLGAVLDRIILESAGWAPVCAYPEDDAALYNLLSDNWFDVLDLSLSTAFRREQDVPRVANTIAQARHASQNPALMVTVGGRLFTEQSTAGVQVGADVAHTTARGVNRTILRTLSAQETLTTTMTYSVTSS
jgi:hypothetical protein